MVSGTYVCHACIKTQHADKQNFGCRDHRCHSINYPNNSPCHYSKVCMKSNHGYLFSESILNIGRVIISCNAVFDFFSKSLLNSSAVEIQCSTVYQIPSIHLDCLN